MTWSIILLFSIIFSTCGLWVNILLCINSFGISWWSNTFNFKYFWDYWLSTLGCTIELRSTLYCYHCLLLVRFICCLILRYLQLCWGSQVLIIIPISHYSCLANSLWHILEVCMVLRRTLYFWYLIMILFYIFRIFFHFKNIWSVIIYNNAILFYANSLKVLILFLFINNYSLTWLLVCILNRSLYLIIIFFNHFIDWIKSWRLVMNFINLIRWISIVRGNKLWDPFKHTFLV